MKLKSLLSESSLKALDRKFGEPLPTLEDTTKAYALKQEKLNEVQGEEYIAISRIVDNLTNIQKSYQRAANIGDKELKDRKYNKHYETILTAIKSMKSLMQILKNKQILDK